MPTSFPPPLPAGWFFSELEGYRNFQRPATYEMFSFEALPPLEETLDGGYAWLRAHPRQYHRSIGRSGAGLDYQGNDPTWRERDEQISQAFAESGEQYTHLEPEEVDALRAFCQEHAFTLPPEFLAFLRAPELHHRIRSCTGCHLALATLPARAKGVGYLIRFLVDSQGSPSWYLLVSDAGEHCVLTSNQVYGYSHDQGAFAEEEEVELASAGRIYLSARSFEEFLCRFWLENEIWYALNMEKTPLTPRQRRYVEHYLRTP